VSADDTRQRAGVEKTIVIWSRSEGVERYLAYSTDIERSPNTVTAYAHDLKDWFTFLGLRGLDWREVQPETSASSLPGCTCRRRPAPVRSRCCPRRGDGEAPLN